MKFINKNLNFHSTFQPQEIYLSKLLDLAANNHYGKKEEISEITGIPTGKNTGKVVPHIKYLEHMGLINVKSTNKGFRLNLTEIGNVVYKNDKYFDEKLTKLICHYYITDYEIGAPQWIYLFKECSNILGIAIKNKNIQAKIQIIFNKKIDLTIVKNGYIPSKGGFFSSLSLLDADNESIEFKENHSSFEFINFYGFSLLDLWQKYSKDENEIILDKIIKNFKWNRIFGFSEEEMLNVFDELQSIGIIKVNRQMRPISIQRITNKEDLINKIYSNLI